MSRDNGEIRNERVLWKLIGHRNNLKELDYATRLRSTCIMNLA